MSEQSPPQSTVQAVSRVAEQVVNGLRTQPMMLALIVLNIVGIAAAVWFLHNLIEVSKENFQIVLKSCLQHLHSSNPEPQ